MAQFTNKIFRNEHPNENCTHFLYFSLNYFPGINEKCLLDIHLFFWYYTRTDKRSCKLCSRTWPNYLTISSKLLFHVFIKFTKSPGIFLCNRMMDGVYKSCKIDTDVDKDVLHICGESSTICLRNCVHIKIKITKIIFLIYCTYYCIYID